MKIELLKKDGNEIWFTLEGAYPAFANALRRTIIEEVPTMAIEDVYFYENNSALYDEIIAHRLGLIPLKTDLKTYKLPESYEFDEFDPTIMVKFNLEKEGPCVVYSGDLVSSDPNIKPVYDNIPIVKLEKGQKIKLEAIAVLGKGKEHAKWSPALCTYKYWPEIEIGELNKEEMEKAVKSCPRKVLKIENNKLVINKDKILDCNLCKACEEITEGKIKVNGDPSKFLFYMESWGQLDPKEILLEAIKILKEKLKNFEAEIIEG